MAADTVSMVRCNLSTALWLAGYLHDVALSDARARQPDDCGRTLAPTSPIVWHQRADDIDIGTAAATASNRVVASVLAVDPTNSRHTGSVTI